MDDNKIIALFFVRNQDAIRHTDAAYGRRLFCLAERIVKNDQDAEESVSDTYLQAWNTIPPQRPTHFYAYIAKICRNFALKKLDWKNAQKRKAEIVALTQEMEECIPGTWLEEELTNAEISSLIGDFLRKQPADTRMIFVRRYWYGDSVSEIALRYEISQNAVMMRLSRTRGKLAAYLKKEGIRV